MDHVFDVRYLTLDEIKGDSPKTHRFVLECLELLGEENNNDMYDKILNFINEAGRKGDDTPPDVVNSWEKIESKG